MFNKRSYITLSLAISITMAGLSSSAQTRRRVNVKATFDQRPFEISREALPPNYLGHAFPALYLALARRQLAGKKGEYETTSDYRKRLAGLESSPLIGSVQRNSLLAFVVAPVRQEYDADAKALHLSLVLTSFTAKWLHNEKLVGSYVGRNAFNRAVRVKAYRYDDYVLAIDKVPTLKNYLLDGSDETFNSSIAIGPLEAQKLRPRVRALLVCVLSPEGVSSDNSHDPPTIDEPYDEYSFIYTMHVDLHAVWFFDYSTGTVLAKLNLADEPLPIAKKTGCAPTITYKAEPHYSEEARRKEITGTVTLSALFY